MSIPSFDYNHIMNALLIGRKGAEDSSELTDHDIAQIDYAIRLLELHNTTAPAPTGYFADEMKKWGTA